MNPSFARLTTVELRKMVDTRAGFWLQLIVVALTLAAVVLVCIFAETDELVFRDLFALAITPASILLPVVGILLVSSEWSQRTALITFTLVPKRMRVMRAKVAAGLVMSLIVAALAFLVAVVANLTVGDEWTLGLAVFGQIVILITISILTGIAFGAAFLSSAPAIVLSFALPIAWSALGFIPWLNDAADWLDTARTTEPFTEHAATAQEWAQFGTSMALWLVLPLAIGLVRVARSEIRAA
jgi:hypothetical protein